MSFIGKVFGDPNEREIKKLRPVAEHINSLEDAMRDLSDDDLRALTGEFKQEMENGKTLDELLPEAYAVVREASRRVLGMRHFDVQLIGGIVLHQGKIAEMRTGEGKTLVATLPAYLNALPGRGVHIVTVNDYLAQRDRDWMGRVYEFLGLSVGVILTTQEPQSAQRREAYGSDITYGTNNEFGFDYLRDNMVADLAHCVQRPLNYAIVDEVDNILIDEARTPLIISGQAEESFELYQKFARVVPRLREEQDYEIDAKSKTVAINESGIDRVEKMLGIGNLYDDIELTRHLENALKAHAIFKRDKDYLVRDGEVLIVDEFTGRVLVGRRYSEGLHQAIEAKEGVRIQNENHTLATITFQNYFRLYKKLSGMTGTALTEAEEFNKIYKLDVMTIPTHQPINRNDNPDLIFRSEEGKFRAVAEEIEERHAAGQPVLVGTTSVEISEHLAALLDRHGIEHNVLNAKQHAREAQVVAQAGRSGAVTIATNMAGRGTDIVLGGNPVGFVEGILRERDIDPEFATEEDRAEALEEAKRRCAADRDVVVAAGGLYIIGTERHESRRIDNQLRGRSGRQGDPGESRFFVSLQDELMRRFGSDRVAGIMGKLGMDDDMPIESKMVTGMLEQAQSKVEAFNFDIRKNVVDYDDVIAAQREVIYADRRAVLEHENMHDRIAAMIAGAVRRIVEEHTQANLPEEWDLDGLVKHFETWNIQVPDELFPEHLNSLKRERLIEDLTALTEEAYANKERIVVEAAEQNNAVQPGEFYMRQFERFVFLHVVDSLWREHIDQLEILRSGIGLRGLAQRDPLVEFRREAYRAFQELKEGIEQQVADIAMRGNVQIEVQAPPPQALPANLKTNTDAIAEASGQAKDAGFTPARPRPTGAAGNRVNAQANGRANGSRVNGSRVNGSRVNGSRVNGKGGAGKGANGARPNGARPNSSRPKGQQGGPARGGMQPIAAMTAAAGAPLGANPDGKPGRNAPCPCGSGKKYKLCHGR